MSIPQDLPRSSSPTLQDRRESVNTPLPIQYRGNLEVNQDQTSIESATPSTPSVQDTQFSKMIKHYKESIASNEQHIAKLIAESKNPKSAGVIPRRRNHREGTSIGSTDPSTHSVQVEALSQQIKIFQMSIDSSKHSMQNLIAQEKLKLAYKDLKSQDQTSIESTVSSMPTVHEKALSQRVQKKICSFCEKEEPKSLCGRCKSIRYCDRNCQMKNWEHHKKSCVQVIVIDQNEELLPLVAKSFNTPVPTNTAFYFKNKNDGADIPPRNFRIIHNPMNLPLKIETNTFQTRSIIAFDSTVPAELGKWIALKFNIPMVMGGKINGETSFNFFSKVAF